MEKILSDNNQSKLEMALLQHMPISYNGLVIENTNRCNAACAMCYQSASPQGSEVLGLAKLDVDVMLRSIREASQIDTVAPRFHLSGGEAFIYLKECLLLFQEASNYGYEDITATTNGYWGRSIERAKNICDKLREVGVTSLEFSWDYWHKDFIKAKHVSNCIKACAENEIGTNLRVLTTKDHNIEEALSMLDHESVDLIGRITVGPTFATGRAATSLAPDSFYDSRSSLEDSCHRVLNLTINSFGNVFPCCAGFDQTENYLIGNVIDESLDGIVARMNNDPLIRRIVFSGVKSLAPILKKSGHNIGDEYHNICHMCWKIFSDKTLTRILIEYFEQRKRSALNRLLEELDRPNSLSQGGENA